MFFKKNNFALICGLLAVMHLSANAASAQKVKELELNHESIQELLVKWNSWKSKHNKRYSSSEQESYRFSIWREKKAEIERDPGEGDYVRGLNMFSDLAHQEWAALYLTRYRKNENEDDGTELLEIDEEHKQSYPTSKDWGKQGKLSEMQSQGQCGSCYAFGTVNAYNAIVNIQTGQNPNYSKQQLVSCSFDFGNGGCGGGLETNSYQYIQKNGLCSNTEYPYASGESRDHGQCQTALQTKCKGQNAAVKAVKRVQPNDADALATVVAQTPVNTGVDASRWSDYQRGVLPASKCGTEINHAVVIVGYEQGQFWKVQNSWGADWGEKGFIRLAWNNSCGCLADNVFPEL